MTYYVGLDVSVQKTAICVIDGKGKVRLETTAASEPEAIKAVLREGKFRGKLIGLEAGPLSQWLYKGLRRSGLSVVCVEARRMATFAAASRDKTDRIDARHIAEALRAGLYQPVHVKSAESQKQRTLLVHRRALLIQARSLEQVIRGSLKTFGLKVGNVSSIKFENRVYELLKRHVDLRATVQPLLSARAVLLKEYGKLHEMTVRLARSDPVARLLMTTPGIGPITALAYKATIDDPRRFAKSSAIGPHLGLTPRLDESGETSRSGSISKMGDGMLRSLLYAAAQVHLTSYRGPSRLQDWGLAVAERRGMKRAIIAVARKMAVILHRMWADGTAFNPGLETE
jgi:transposase